MASDAGAREAYDSWTTSMPHLREKVKSELRMNASGFTAYWLTQPESLPPELPFVPFAEAHIDFSVSQLRHIIHRMVTGHDSP